MKKTLCVFTVLLILVTCFAGCAKSAYDGVGYAQGSKTEEYFYDNEADVVPEAYEETASSASLGGLDAASFVDNDRKLIYTSEYSIETKKFEDDYHAIITALEKTGGFIASEYTYGTAPEAYGDSGRNAELIFRIPVNDYSVFLNALDGVGSVVSKVSKSDDVTTAYYDNEARIELYEAHYEKLMEYLKNASDINDVISIEREITDVLYTLDSLKGEKRHMDDRIQYCTVTIYLNEVVEYTQIATSKETFSSRVSSSFMGVIKWLGRFFEGFAVVFIAALPVLAILFGIFSAIFFPLRAAKIKKKAKKNTASE